MLGLTGLPHQDSSEGLRSVILSKFAHLEKSLQAFQCQMVAKVEQELSAALRRVEENSNTLKGHLDTLRQHQEQARDLLVSTTDHRTFLEVPSRSLPHNAGRRCAGGTQRGDARCLRAGLGAAAPPQAGARVSVCPSAGISPAPGLGEPGGAPPGAIRRGRSGGAPQRDPRRHLPAPAGGFARRRGPQIP